MQKKNLIKKYNKIFFISILTIVIFCCKEKEKKNVLNLEERKSCLDKKIVEKEFCLYEINGELCKVFFGKGLETNKMFNPNITEDLSDADEVDNYTLFTQRTYSSVFDIKGVRMVKYLSFCRDSLFEVNIYSSTKKVDSLNAFIENNLCLKEDLKIHKASNDDYYSLNLLITNGKIIN